MNAATGFLSSEFARIAFLAPNDNEVIYTVAFFAVVAFLYSASIGARIGGGLICVAAMLAMSGPPGDSNNWMIAAVVLAVFRPKWLWR